jgi:hypothetical protein
MASPFPGMDPYLEQFWGDIHQTLITYARDQLNARLPSELRARVQERVFVESPLALQRVVYPDIRVAPKRGKPARTKKATQKSSIAVAEPLRIRLQAEPVTQGYIEIIDVATRRRVITVIEVLSPSNKVPGAGRDQYQRTPQECMDGNINLVEIDLLREGPWVLAVPEALVPQATRTAYRVCVFRAGVDPIGEVYPISLRERLPAISVPLRSTDDDVPLDLQPLLDQCYNNGGYDDDIDYAGEPIPPLSNDDSSWAAVLLGKRRHGRTPAKRGRKRER